MLRNLCKWPDPKLHVGRVIAAVAVVIAILIIGWHGFQTIRGVHEGFESGNPNAEAFNEFRKTWGDRAVASGRIMPIYFQTYAAILNIPPPTATTTEEEYTNLVEATASAIKLWYVNAKYNGNLAELAAAIDASKPKFFKPFSGSGEPVAAEVPAKDAADGLNKNLDYELTKFLQPTYNAYKELLDMGAQIYLTLPDPPPSAAEVRKLRESKYPLVEARILEESGGKTFPFVKLWSNFSRLKSAGLNPTQLTIATFNQLPPSIDIYVSTLSYLNIKAKNLATNLNNLDAPPGAGPDEQLIPVRGAINTLKVDSSTGSEAFIDMPDSQSMTDSLRGQASMGADDVDTEVAKVKSGSIDDQLQAAYRVSETRRRLLKEQLPTFEATLKNTMELYGRLKAMRDAAGSNASPAFAAIAGGATLDEALSGSAIEAFFSGKNGLF